MISLLCFFRLRDNKSYFTFLLGSIARSLQMDRQAANDDFDDIRRDENLTVAR